MKNNAEDCLRIHSVPLMMTVLQDYIVGILLTGPMSQNALHKEGNTKHAHLIMNARTAYTAGMLQQMTENQIKQSALQYTVSQIIQFLDGLLQIKMSQEL